ncbi:MAG: hypothetical protein IT429_05115 [Gemmataceae bacterium]|nr:hypothetical protein [Gemmataceae bacterium]
MSAGSWTLTCLLLVHAQAPSDVTHLKMRGFQVPVDIEPARRAQIREILLYYSPDRGKSWYRHDEAVLPTAAGFKFHAPADGEYWFRSAAVNLNGKQEPEDIYRGQPEQKIIIDTIPPTVRLPAARRDGEDIVVSWEVQESHPEPNGFKLEYQILDGSTPVWLPIQAAPRATGEARMRPNTSASVVVRLQMRDLAGNVAEAKVEVAGPAGAKTASVAVPAPTPSRQTQLPTPVGTAQGQQAPLPPDRGNPPPPAPPGLPNAGGLPTPGVPVGRSQPSPPALPQRAHEPRPVVANSAHQARSAPGAAQQPGPAPGPGPRKRPDAQIVNDKEITLEYQLSKVGPSGVKSIQLYLTQDGGKRWVEYANDPDPHQATSGKRYQRTLELPGEGVFGLFLVLRNPAGVGRPAPKPGDSPEMTIEVDLSPPTAELYQPVADPTQAGALLLNWAAKDRNLGDQPITLEYAEDRTGPWKVIAADLPNLGKHSWIVPPGTPASVYLKLRVRDRAGNEATAVTDQPQVVDLSVPEGMLLSVRPADKQGP